MKRVFGVVAALTVVGTVGQARADIVQTPGEDNPFVKPATRPQATYVLQDPGLPPTWDNDVAAPNSNVIYLANCKPGGCPINPGGNNATANPPTSTIPDQQSVVQPFAYSDAVWQQVVECVRQTYAPFAVTVTDQRPTSGGYHMAIVAGRPQDVQMQSGVGGVSPFSCGFIPNAVSFSFANVYGGDVLDICWTVAQETAHSWGLDHKFDNRDPMTYLSGGPAKKSFQNQLGPCGEYSARNCQCGGTMMNSYDAIIKTFGGSTPTPPVVGITAPMEGEIVAAGFPIRATVMDDISVNKVELKIDGMLISTLTKPPFVWNAPASIGQGKHKIKVIGYDIANTPGELEVNVSLGKACVKPSDCDNNTDTCVEGRCVPGSGVQGGLGQPCVMHTECASGQCGSDAAGNRYCVETCSVAANACPPEFACIATAGDMGVCWPSPSDEGICNAGGNTNAPAMIFLGLVALLITRKRVRRS